MRGSMWGRFQSTRPVKAGTGRSARDAATPRLRRRAAAGPSRHSPSRVATLRARRPADAASACSAARSTRPTSATWSPPSTCATPSTLDVVILMVDQRARGRRRASRPITPALDRLAMVEAAVADVPGLEAGRLEIDLGGPSYTADTLAALAERRARRRAVHDRRRRRGRRAADVGALTRRWSSRSTMVVVDRPGDAVVLPTDDRPGSTSRCPASRCRAPTCGPGSSTAVRSTTSSPTPCSTSSRTAACTRMSRRDRLPAPAARRHHACVDRDHRRRSVLAVVLGGDRCAWRSTTPRTARRRAAARRS